MLQTQNHLVITNRKANITITYSLNSIHQGKGVHTIVINSFLSEDTDDISDWLKIVDQRYYQLSVHRNHIFSFTSFGFGLLKQFHVRRTKNA